MSRYELFCRIDDRLAEQPGAHRRPQWWDDHYRRFYEHPTAKRSILQVGRGGDKSTMGRRFAETEMLSRWRIPSGERHYLAWASENTDEANQRPWQVEQDFRALGIPCTRSGNTVELDELPIGFRSFACRIGAVSGFRCIGFVCDEEAKWRNADGSSNPAAEVVASLRAMCVTHPDARELHLSSPLSTIDYHAEQFALGDTDFQIVGHAASWIANPDAISEARTRQLERDERIWSREYAAIPSSELSSAFSQAHIDGCFGDQPSGNFHDCIAIVDPNRGGADRFTLGFASWCSPIIETPFNVWFTREFEPDENGLRRWVTKYLMQKDGKDVEWQPPDLHSVLCLFATTALSGSGDQIADTIARECALRGACLVVSDQGESRFFEAALRQRGLRSEFRAWTNQNKAEAIRRIRRLMADSQLWIAPNETMRKELHSYAEQITSSGNIRHNARGSGHDDFAALLMTATMADLDGLIPGGVVSRRSGRNIVNDS